MTILIALKDKKNKRIILGADKQATIGQTKYKLKSKLLSLPLIITDGYGNIIKKEKIHLAFAGAFYLKDFFKYGFTIPDMDVLEDFIEYLYNSFLPEVREKLTENQLVEINNNQLDANLFIVLVYKDEIYRIGSNFCVEVLGEEYFIEGSGYEVALGSLYTNLKFHKNLNRVEMVKQAIRSAGATTIYCNEDVDLKVIHYK